jgi:hypothetical protein
MKEITNALKIKKAKEAQNEIRLITGRGGPKFRTQNPNKV